MITWATTELYVQFPFGVQPGVCVFHASTEVSKAFCSCLPDKGGSPLIRIQNYKVPIHSRGVVVLFNPPRCLV